MTLVAPPNLPPPPPPVKPPPEPLPNLESPPGEPVVVEDGPPVVLIAGLVVSVAGVVLSHWGLRTIFDTIWHNPRSWFKRIVTRSARALVAPVRQLERKLIGEFSSRLMQLEPAITKWVHSEAVVVEKLSGVIVSSNQATYKALYALRHTVVPTLIHRAVVPLYQALAKQAAAINDLDDRFAQARVYINEGLAKLPWGAGATFDLAIRQWMNSYTQLFNDWYDNWRKWLFTFRTVDWPTVRDAFWRVYDDLYLTGQQSIQAIRLRLGKIETSIQGILADPTTWVLAALGLAAIPALSAGGMRTALQNLTCRNTQTVAKNLCAMDEALLAQLLAGGFLLTFLLDPKEVARVAAGVEGVLDVGIREMAGVGSVSFGEAEAAVERGMLGFLGL